MLKPLRVQQHINENKPDIVSKCKMLENNFLNKKQEQKPWMFPKHQTKALKKRQSYYNN